ncbi:hypothetical protein [Xanthobacter agilis]|uniref:hypothetical protein n=1 Tax=Xanthobacter agilis TaxID=47492 RepID=UPI003728445C
MADVLVLGDSHSNYILAAVRSAMPHVSFIGGQLPLGSGWQNAFFSGPDPLRFSRAEAQQKFEDWASEATGRRVSSLHEVDIPILFSLSNIEHLVHSWMWTKWSPVSSVDRDFLSEEVIREVVHSFYAHNLAFMIAVKEGGARAINVVSPLPRISNSDRVPVHDAVRKVLQQFYDTIGIPLVDITDETRDSVSGALDPQFASTMANDKIHGNSQWGAVMAEHLVPVIKGLI